MIRLKMDVQTLYKLEYKRLVQDMGKPFTMAYVEWLFREISHIPQRDSNGPKMQLAMRQRVEEPLNKYAKNELGMDDDTIVRTRALMREHKHDYIDDIIDEAAANGKKSRSMLNV